MERTYRSGTRPTCLTLAMVHAEGRAEHTIFRSPDGHHTNRDGIEVDAPALDGRRVLYVASDALPPEVARAAEDSVLVSATTGDPNANSSIDDLITSIG
jgi:hypothetical protein